MGRTRFKERTASFRGPPAPRLLPTSGFILLLLGRQMLTYLYLLGPGSGKSPHHLLPLRHPPPVFHPRSQLPKAFKPSGMSHMETFSKCLLMIITKASFKLGR